MDNLDKLLERLKAEYKTPPAQQRPKPITDESKIESSEYSASLLDNLLAEVKGDFVVEDAAENLRKQQELAQAKIQQEKIQAQKLAALKNQAQIWLDELEEFSPEGLWFERFAENYPSKLEAAIEYLQMNE